MFKLFIVWGVPNFEPYPHVAGRLLQPHQSLIKFLRFAALRAHEVKQRFSNGTFSQYGWFGPISTSGNCRGFHRSSLFLQGLLLWLLRRQETIMLSVEVPWKQEFNTKWVLYTIPNWREYPVKIVFFLIGKMRTNHWDDILSIMGYRGITQTRALHALCCSGFYQTRGAKPQISTEPDDL